MSLFLLGGLAVLQKKHILCINNRFNEGKFEAILALIIKDYLRRVEQQYVAGQSRFASVG